MNKVSIQSIYLCVLQHCELIWKVSGALMLPIFSSSHWDFLSFLAFWRYFCQVKDMVLQFTEVKKNKKKRLELTERGILNCVSAALTCFFYCNGIALQPVPAYWVLRLSPLQFKQVWHSDKLFSFVLVHKSWSPPNKKKHIFNVLLVALYAPTGKRECWVS